MTDPAAYLTRLRDEGLVEAVVRPKTTAELSASLASAKRSIVVGTGSSGAFRPKNPVTVIRLDGLPADAAADALSQTVEVPSWWTWSVAEAFAQKSGLTLGGLVDTWPDRSVGGTLAAAEILPALWMANTVRGACIGIHAFAADGGEYQHIISPRTASGPDLRAIFLGTNGQAGAIVRVALRAEPIDDVAWMRGALHPTLQSVLSDFGSVLSVRGDEAALRARLRLGTRLAELAANRLSAIGFVRAETPPPSPPPPIVVTVPWDGIDSVGGLPGAYAMALGPTHVAFALPSGDSESASAVALGPLATVLRFTPEAFG